MTIIAVAQDADLTARGPDRTSTQIDQACQTIIESSGELDDAPQHVHHGILVPSSVHAAAAHQRVYQAIDGLAILVGGAQAYAYARSVGAIA